MYIALEHLITCESIDVLHESDRTNKPSLQTIAMNMPRTPRKSIVYKFEPKSAEPGSAPLNRRRLSISGLTKQPLDLAIIPQIAQSA